MAFTVTVADTAHHFQCEPRETVPNEMKAYVQSEVDRALGSLAPYIAQMLAEGKVTFQQASPIDEARESAQN